MGTPPSLMWPPHPPSYGHLADEAVDDLLGGADLVEAEVERLERGQPAEQLPRGARAKRPREGGQSGHVKEDNAAT
eukprot:1391587-Prymnesium_polylepis.1